MAETGTVPGERTLLHSRVSSTPTIAFASPQRCRFRTKRSHEGAVGINTRAVGIAGVVHRSVGVALLAKTAHAGHREGLGPTGCSSANRTPDSCKHRSSHDSAALSAAAVGVEQQPVSNLRHDCSALNP